MIVTIASYKGGVGKTTTAVHLAAYLTAQAPTVLIDGDPNRSATRWTRRGTLPFPVVDERRAVKTAREFEHLVIDTQARLGDEDLKELAQGCDLLVIPTTPDMLALDALGQTIEALSQLQASNYKILLSIVPPKPSRDGEEARSALNEQGLPVFGAAVRRYAVYRSAALEGVPVYEVKDPRAREAWRDYQAVGQEISL